MRVLPVELFVRTAKNWNVSIGVSMVSANTRKKSTNIKMLLNGMLITSDFLWESCA